MKILKEAAKRQVAIPGSVMQLVTRGLIVAVVDELSRVMVDRVGPVWILSRREENDQILVLAPTSKSEAPHVAYPWKNLGDGFSCELVVSAALVDRIDDQVGTN